MDDLVEGFISLKLTSLQFFDCPICYEPLSIPVFQCENGHIICSICCANTALKKKCPSCRLPIGSIRCRAIENVLDSVVKVKCQNSKYGCKEVISYIKKDYHERRCQYTPFSCPLIYCNFFGSSSQISQHCTEEDKNSTIQIEYGQIFHLTLDVDAKFVVIREKTDDQLLFILINSTESLGNAITISSVGPTNMTLDIDYDIQTEVGSHDLKFRSCTMGFDKKTFNPSASEFFLVPSYFLSQDLTLELDICLWGPG